MFSWSSLQIIIDDHLDILLNRLLEEDVFDGFIAPKIKDYYIFIISFFAFFSILYISLDPIFKHVLKNKYYLKLNEYKRIDWNSRIIAFVHALIISSFCITLISKYGFPWNKTENDYDEKEVDLYCKAVSISIGYFIWDIIYCIWDYKKGGIGFVIHGICAFLIYVFTFKHPVLSHYSILYLNYEISTIFLNFYWILDKLELTGSFLQLVVSYMLLVTFFLVRIAFGSVTIVKLLHDIIFERKVCSVYLSLYFFINIIPMQTLNFIWFYKMLRSVYRHFIKTSKHKGKSAGKKAKKTD